ncbi:Serine/threonine-protein kinase-like protein At1g28390 [Linum grandiflorum]
MGYLPCNADSAVVICGDGRSHHNRPTSTAKHFTYSELAAATADFSADNFLGKGSHGAVYRATLDGGKLIAAVKRTTHQPPTSFRMASSSPPSPAENEIEILSKVRHRRLVNLIGFCAERRLIVVEYMPNGSLYDVLHSGSVSLPGWTRRVRFAHQVAKAVQALHGSDPPVIHRDIKSSNVLIDAGFNARLGDFGLALRGHVEDVRVKCTPPAGTLGYLDPGYLAPGDLSSKSDVFSFGILLLEIISGRKAIDVNFSPSSVVDWAVPLIKRLEFDSVCDGRIGVPADGSVIRSLAVLAARCVQSPAEKRPGMAQVVEGLKAVRKRAEAPAILMRLRRRFGPRVEELPDPAVDGEDVVAVAGMRRRVMSRRNRKVSNASISNHGSNGNRESDFGAADYYRLNKYSGDVVEAGEGTNCNGNGVRTEAGVTKLSKSMSTGVLNRRRTSVRSNSHDGSGAIDSKILKLQIGADEKSEKPLFSIKGSS